MRSSHLYLSVPCSVYVPHQSNPSVRVGNYGLHPHCPDPQVLSTAHFVFSEHSVAGMTWPLHSVRLHALGTQLPHPWPIGGHAHSLQTWPMKGKYSRHPPVDSCVDSLFHSCGSLLAKKPSLVGELQVREMPRLKNQCG